MVRVIPIQYLKTAKQKGTRVLRNEKTGRLEGRRALKSGIGDSTKVRYLTKDIDVTGDRKPDYFAGQIFGRSKKKRGLAQAPLRTRQRVGRLGGRA